MSQEKSAKMSSRAMTVERWEYIGFLFGCPLQIGLPNGENGDLILKRVNEFLEKRLSFKPKTEKELDKELEDIISRL